MHIIVLGILWCSTVRNYVHPGLIIISFIFSDEPPLPKALQIMSNDGRLSCVSEDRGLFQNIMLLLHVYEQVSVMITAESLSKK